MSPARGDSHSRGCSGTHTPSEEPPHLKESSVHHPPKARRSMSPRKVTVNPPPASSTKTTWAHEDDDTNASGFPITPPRVMATVPRPRRAHSPVDTDRSNNNTERVQNNTGLANFRFNPGNRSNPRSMHKASPKSSPKLSPRASPKSSARRESREVDQLSRSLKDDDPKGFVITTLMSKPLQKEIARKTRPTSPRLDSGNNSPIMPPPVIMEEPPQASYQEQHATPARANGYQHQPEWQLTPKEHQVTPVVMAEPAHKSNSHSSLPSSRLLSLAEVSDSSMEVKSSAPSTISSPPLRPREIVMTTPGTCAPKPPGSCHRWYCKMAAIGEFNGEPLCRGCLLSHISRIPNA